MGSKRQDSWETKKETPCMVGSSRGIECQHVHRRWREHRQVKIVRDNERIILRQAALHGHTLRVLAKALVWLVPKDDGGYLPSEHVRGLRLTETN